MMATVHARFARLNHALSRLREEPRPLRFLASRVLWRTGLCERLTFATADGFRMRFHPSAISAALWEDPGFRREDVDLIQAILRPGDTYVDVGANVGQLAIVAALRTGDTGKVVAIEAHPRTCRFLRDNVALNALRQIDVRNVAVGEGEGHVSFTDLATDDQNHVQDDTRGDGAAASRAAPPAANTVEVEVTTLDRLCPAGPVRLLKVDVEGFEIRALDGAADVLRRTDAVYIEESARNLARFRATPADLRARLDAAGFRSFATEHGALTENPAHCGGGPSQNLLAIKPDHVAEIAARLTARTPGPR